MLPITIAAELPDVVHLADLLQRAGREVQVLDLDRHAATPLTGILVHALPPGTRLVPETLAEWVGESAGRSLVLVCAEALSRPAISLHRGRILLLEGSQPCERMAELIATWMTVGGSDQHQHHHAARWTLHIAGDRARQLVTCLPGADATVAIGPQPGEAQQEKLREALQDPPTSRLLRLAEDCGRAALIHLDVHAGEWLLASQPSTPVLIAIGGRGRVPGAWMLRAGPGVALHRRLRAHAGDVVLATWGLPMPVLATLGAALEKGAAAVMTDFFHDTGSGAAVAVEAR